METFDNITAMTANGWYCDNCLTAIAELDGSAKSFDDIFFFFVFENGVSQHLYTPVLDLTNGIAFSFYTQSDAYVVDFPDAMNILYSTSGSSTDRNDFTNTLLQLNPNYTNDGFPFPWTKITLTIPPTNASGRILSYYTIPNAINYGTVVGIDDVTIVQGDASCLPDVLICKTVLVQGFSIFSSAQSDGWILNTLAESGANGINLPAQDYYGPGIFQDRNGVNQYVFSPVLNLTNGIQFYFYTMTNADTTNEQLRVLYLNDNSTNPADYYSFLVTINPDADGSYPLEYTKYSATIPSQDSIGRVMFWYSYSGTACDTCGVAIESITFRELENCVIPTASYSITSTTGDPTTTGDMASTTGEATTTGSSTTGSIPDTVPDYMFGMFCLSNVC